MVAGCCFGSCAWGATLMVGQVATSGRLEVTALGDQMNECARIEAAAKSGAILASKDLIERLDPDDAAATGVDAERIGIYAVGGTGGREREGDSRRRHDPRGQDLSTGAGTTAGTKLRATQTNSGQLKATQSSESDRIQLGLRIS